MYALYAEGATLEEVGDRFGITRERVRQIFQAAEISTRSIAETSGMRHDRVIDERGNEILEAFAELKDIEAVAHRLDIPQVIVKELVDKHFPASERRHAKKARAPVYSTSELIAYLQEAGAAVPGNLTTGKYKNYADGRFTEDGRPWPSYQTHANRLGTWRKALAQAGLDVDS